MARASWKAAFEADREDYEEELREDPFEGWDRDRMPEVSVEEALIAALQVLYAVPTSRLAEGFLGRCLVLAGRALEERRLKPRAVGWPRNMACLLRARAHARGLLGEDAREDLVRAGDHFQETLPRAARTWNDYAEANALAVTRAYLLGGRPEQARAVLERHPSFRWHPEHGEALADTLATLSRQVGQGVPASASSFFEQLRHPGYSWSRKVGPGAPPFLDTDLARLEWALLVHRMSTPRCATLDWRAAVALVPSGLAGKKPGPRPRAPEERTRTRKAATRKEKATPRRRPAR